MSERDIAAEINKIIGRGDFAHLFPRDPRYRYYESPDGWQFHWTTERMGDGKYAAAVYRPTGPGSQSGKKKLNEIMRKGGTIRYKLVKETHRRKRKDAKELAYRWYRQRLHEKFDGTPYKQGDEKL